MQFAIDDANTGATIVTDLLNRRLIACAQAVGPVTSRYWWHGSINTAREWLFVCKTTEARRDDVIEAVRLLHPYEVPEIVAFDITGGLDAYAAWIVAEATGTPGTERS